MNKLGVLVFALILVFSSQTSWAFGIRGSYAANNMAKYYPQSYNSRYNRYNRAPKTYIYSPNQARYYGYRVPQMNMGYGYNRYAR